MLALRWRYGWRTVAAAVWVSTILCALTWRGSVSVTCDNARDACLSLERSLEKTRSSLAACLHLSCLVWLRDSFLLFASSFVIFMQQVLDTGGVGVRPFGPGGFLELDGNTVPIHYFHSSG